MSSLPLSDHSGLLDGLYAGYGGGHHGHQASTSSSSVLLDGNAQQELDAAAAKEVVTGKKGDRGEKAAAALKNHSEAERRRRERINAHLATLRGMLPCTDKMDKAALLAEVITHVKKLKTNAARISSRCPVPADADEVTVELVHDAAAAASSFSSQSQHGIISGSGGGFLVRATLSCDDSAGLFADVKDALRPLRLKVVGSDVTTLGGRSRLAFFFFLVITSSSAACNVNDELSLSLESVRRALQSVLDRANSALEFAPRTSSSLLNKRRRVVSTFESSSSSS